MSKYANDIIPDEEPEVKEPEREWAKRTLAIVALLFLAWVIGSLMSCSPSRKNSKAYERAALGNPVTPKDSANAFIVAKKVVKPQSPKVIPGKTIKLPPVIKPVLDVKQRSKIVDSLTAVFKDRDSISREENEISVADAFNTGYDKGFWDCEKSQPKEIVCPPVICPPDTALQLNYSQLENRYGLTKDSLLICTTERNIAQKEAKTRLYWIIGLWVIILTGVTVWVKGKLKPKNILTEIQK